MTQTWSVETLIPHSGDMVLIDEVLHASDESIQTRITPVPGGMFNREDGSVPAWVGIEYMAQTIAAFAGVKASKVGQDIRLGFLLGTRHYHSNVTHFPPHVPLTISAECSIQDSNGLSVFNCSIFSENTATGGIGSERIRVEASINVFQPDNVDIFLRENT